jgi:hypothetical protein
LGQSDSAHREIILDRIAHQQKMHRGGGSLVRLPD